MAKAENRGITPLHFGPRITKTSGLAKARHIAASEKKISASVSYVRMKVRRYRSESDCSRERTGIRTALIGMEICCKGRARHTASADHTNIRPRAVARWNKSV